MAERAVGTVGEEVDADSRICPTASSPPRLFILAFLSSAGMEKYEHLRCKRIGKSGWFRPPVTPVPDNGEMTDTEAQAEERWMEMLRQMTPAQRLARTWELSEAVRQMFLANVQHLDEAAQRRRLAEACYGPEAAERMFGK